MLEYDFLLFYENLKFLRAKHNLSKKAFSKLTGISVKNITAIESEIKPGRMKCSVFVNIFHSFDILPSDILNTKLK